MFDDGYANPNPSFNEFNSTPVPDYAQNNQRPPQDTVGQMRDGYEVVEHQVTQASGGGKIPKPVIGKSGQ